MATDDDEVVIPLSAQTRRPLETALRQQEIDAWYPILDPWWVIGCFLVIAASFIPTGLYLISSSNSEAELKTQYDAWDNPHPQCGIGTTANAKKVCSLTFTATKDMEPPILVHYEITNFYQNHRTYYRSRDDAQLFGSLTQSTLAAQLCDPLNILGNTRINPCGLMPNTFFNDIIQLESGADDQGNNLAMIEDGIAWQSDIDYKFRQPDGFKAEVCPQGTTNVTCCEGSEWSCTEATLYNGELYRYFYPDDNTTQYLYETYPDIINPVDGVTNEHFIVWMRTAALPRFRKLYGWFNQKIPKGSTLTFRIVNNWEVTSFKGGKSLIVSTNNIFGGKNDWSGPVFIGVGGFCGACALFFLAKQLVRPRKTADKKYLQYKDD